MSIRHSRAQNDSSETPEKPRRWPQFGLHTLLLLTLVAALPLSWIAKRRHHTLRENAAIGEIRQMGGKLSFYGREDLLGWKPPLWLHKFTGGGPRTATLWFPEPSKFTDSDVELLLQLDPLPAVCLHNTEIADRGLSILAKHRGIERLDLRGTAVTNTGVTHVAAMSQLTSLDLRDTEVTSSGLDSIGRMPNLKVLELSGHQITDQAVERLSRLELTWIGLRRTKVTDKTLALLAKMPLRHVYLEETCMSDVGMSELGRVRTLEILDVSGTQITDTGLSAFANHPRLSALDVTNACTRSLGSENVSAISLEGPPQVVSLGVVKW